MGRAILQLCLVLLSSKYANCDISEIITFPDTVKDCYEKAKQQPVPEMLAKEACWRVYLEDKNKHPIINKTVEEFFKNEYEIQKFGLNDPPTGFRTRYDIRVLTDQQRNDVVAAFEVLYQKGIMRMFSFLHGTQLFRKHGGRAFLPWHRVFLTALEEQLRKVNPSVSLPYWDYTTDYYMASPYKSVIWTHCFVGNGNGDIRTGPFAGWYGGNNLPIKRQNNHGDDPCPPKLISKEDMVGILRHCHFQNITTGNESYYNNKDNLEVHHDGVHDWVGGDMDVVRISAFDPIFWMHHAFIDYIWEQFRERQSSSECNVDVETDYPKTNLSRFNNSLNAATDPLHGFEYMQIKDGLWKNWTTKFFKYEPQPQCPDCGGSPFLTCDQEVDKERYPDGVCVSKDWDACHSVEKVDKEPHPVLPSNDPEGFPGIGRTRMNSDEENRRLLHQKLGKKTEFLKEIRPKQEHADEGFAAWKIVVIVICCLLAVINIAAVIYFCVSNHRRNARYQAPELSLNPLSG